MRPIGILTVATFLALGLGAPTLAQQHPNIERGFSPEKLYQFGDLDHVNLFNGNLSLTIPIGRRYAAGGALAYGLTLTYNSKVWDIEERGFGVTLYQALPNRRSNAGVGWQISLGRLVAPGDPTNNTPLSWLYVGPDGAEHTFHDTLHAGAGEAAVMSVRYTRDGSYLRMRDLSASQHEVEFPDGTIHKFDKFDESYRLIEIRDQFANPNVVTVEYSPTTWTIADRFGRQQRVVFASHPIDGGFANQVERVELVGFGGALEVYELIYTSTPISRPTFRPISNLFCYDDDPVTSEDPTVPLLTQIRLPDGSTFEPQYFTDNLPNPICRSGALKSLRLPTLGSLEWDYVTYALPTEGCVSNSATHWPSRSPGVAARRQRDASGILLGEWQYGIALSAPPQPAPGDTTCDPSGIDLPSEEVTAVVITPLEDRIEHYFSSWPNFNNSSGGFSRGDYGLPFTRLAGDGAGRFLSRRTYDCDSAGNNCFANLDRSEYVRYERDDVLQADGNYSGCLLSHKLAECNERNRRVASQSTIFDDDAGRLISVDQSDFDGLGHYRTRVTSGNLPDVPGVVGSPTRTVVTAWNPANGTYPGGFTMRSSVDPVDPWVDVYTTESVKEGGDGKVRFAQHCHVAGTTFIRGTRIRKHDGGGVDQSNDLLVRFDADSSGNLVAERYFGGDTQVIGTGAPGDPSDPCSVSLPAPKYQIDHTYQFGERATSKHLGANFFHLEQTIDAAGLVSQSKDTATLATNYEYDTMGRLEWIKPTAGHGGWTEFVYDTADSATDLANVVTRRRGNGSKSAPILARSIVRFDALGRLAREEELLADGTSSGRETKYDAAGNRASVSESQIGNPTKLTKYLNYDPFGRPGIIRPPDGENHDVILNHFGVREIRRTAKLCTTITCTPTSESSALTKEFYDVHGRLIQVTEPNTFVTTYAYDYADRLRRVCQGASGSGCGQERVFSYDNRGFLLSEKHPEKGPSGNGQVTYSQYDARGNLGRKQDGPNDLTFAYDAAQRPTLIRETSGAQRPLKEFTYGAGVASPDWSRGKVKSGTRHNHVLFAGMPLTSHVGKTYTYGGRDGRVSRVATSARLDNNPTGEDFVSDYLYTELGRLASVTYPRCTHPDCTNDPGTAAAPSVAFTYSNGYLTSVPGYATSLSYHPNGLLNQIAHQNGVTTTQANDPNAMRRPASISATHPSLGALWGTGSYAYDGSGNIARMGSFRFSYDLQGRLTDSSTYLEPVNQTTARQQAYEFDDFGNIKKITTTACAGPENLDLSTTQPVTGLVNETACRRIDAGPYPIGMATVTFTAGEAIGLRSGFSVAAGATFRAVIDSGLQGGGGYTTPTSGATNRLTAGTYDAAGNLTAWSGNTYVYDQFNLMQKLVSGTEEWYHAYDVDDERLFSVSFNGSYQLWHLRDPGHKVLRRYRQQFEGPNNVWRLEEDYIHRAGLLLASATPSGTRHFHLDHLGTPRLITSSTAQVLAYHVYFPFGQEATPFAQDTQPMKFTGHERDLHNLAGAEDDLDYLHARFRSPLTGRFLSTDPVLTARAMKRPQAWNRYTYTIGNPLKYIDPTGELWFKIDDKWTYLKGVDVIEEVTVGSDGSFSSKQVQGKGRFVGFNGSQATLYGKDGSIRRYGAVSGVVDSFGRTQPGLQGVRNVGPIPEGRYSFNSANIQNWNNLTGANQAASWLSPIAQKLGLGKLGAWPGGTYAWGTQRVPLTPAAGTDTLGRSNFFIHGGAEPGSAGCIDLCRQAGDFFNAVAGTTGDIEVEVDYP
jgi:RHS repeat-associated protein